MNYEEVLLVACMIITAIFGLLSWISQTSFEYDEFHDAQIIDNKLVVTVNHVRVYIFGPPTIVVTADGKSQSDFTRPVRLGLR